MLSDRLHNRCIMLIILLEILFLDLCSLSVSQKTMYLSLFIVFFVLLGYFCCWSLFLLAQQISYLDYSTDWRTAQCVAVSFIPFSHIPKKILSAFNMFFKNYIVVSRIFSHGMWDSIVCSGLSKIRSSESTKQINTFFLSSFL